MRRAAAACGGDTTLATHVLLAARVDGGLSLTFGFDVRPDRVERTAVFIPVED